MNNATRILTMCLVVLVLSIARANAAVEVNDTTNINLTVFIPCAAGGAGEVVDLILIRFQDETNYVTMAAWQDLVVRI